MSNISHSLDQRAGNLFGTKAQKLGKAWLKRPFGRGAGPRVLIYYRATPICWSQIYPFVHYSGELADRFDAQIRFRPVSEFLDHRVGPQADIILVQPWFTEDPETLSRAFDALATRQPDAQISFLDSFAHNDLRLGRAVTPYIQHYFKKSLFKDRSVYLRDFKGDTNLTEFYGDLYTVEQGGPVPWHVPEPLLNKLQLSPNFFTAPRFLNGFDADAPPQAPRSIDVQSRLGTKGSPWYQAMRQDAADRISAIPNLTLSPPGKLDLGAFMAELENAKLCFSPFGYGELCWRDVEAFQTGAVLIKPDMGHLETLPDLYIPGVTYLPVKWDFSDLEAVVTTALNDHAQRQCIALAAYCGIKDYIENTRFLDDMAILFKT
jgi:hypothetical protein